MNTNLPTLTMGPVPGTLPAPGRYFALITDVALRERARTDATQPKKFTLVLAIELFDATGELVGRVVDWLPIARFSRTFQIASLFLGAGPGQTVTIDPARIAKQRCVVDVHHVQGRKDPSRTFCEVRNYLALPKPQPPAPAAAPSASFIPGCTTTPAVETRPDDLSQFDT